MKEKSRFFKNIRLRRVCLLALVSILSASCLGGYFLNGQVMLLGEEGALTLPKGPYQMYVSPGEVLIGAQLPQGTQGSVSYWKAGEKQSKVTVPFKSAWDRIEMARLSGLSPDDKYEIEVNIGQYSTDAHPIVTGIEQGEPFRFLVVGDTKPDRELIHPMLVDQMVKREAAFYIHLGDFVRQGDRVEDWNLFFDIHRPLMSRMPILPVVGNHDTSDAGLYTGLFLFDQRGTLPKRYYKAVFGNVLVIVLDSSSPITVGGPQYRFLDEALESSLDDSIDHVFIAIHEPLYSSGKHGGTKDFEKTILPLIESYPVTAVFSGHDHHYERSKKINGIVHIISGGGGADLTEVDQSSFCEKAFLAHHFVEITVHGNDISLKAINLQGKVMDEVRIK